MATTPAPNPLLQLTPDQVNRAEPAQWSQAIKHALNDVRCATPAFLTEDVDPATQTVTVQIAVQERVRTSTGPQWWDMPIIIKVPLVVPRGGGFSLTLPLKKGDEGMLVFCDTCLDFWWVNGQSNAPKADNATSPSGTQRQNEVRRHHFWDCGFLPGMCSQPNVLTNYSTDATQLRSDDGTVAVSVSGSSVALMAPLVIATQNLQVGNGATGSFTTPTGQVVTVQDGIVTNIY